MKPNTLDVATDFRLALLWLMDRLQTARLPEAMAAFEREFGALIPAEHREMNNIGPCLSTINPSRSSGYSNWQQVATII
jgi:hypothetical protein